MSEYPTEITEAVLARNAQNSDAVIEFDIRETEDEIRRYRILQECEEQQAAASFDPQIRKMSSFKASVRPHQIEERQAFVDFLRRLLAARKALVSP